jgi:hypothetical protein
LISKFLNKITQGELNNHILEFSVQRLGILTASDGGSIVKIDRSGGYPDARGYPPEGLRLRVVLKYSLFIATWLGCRGEG